jgi:hypothetical protein
MHRLHAANASVENSAPVSSNLAHVWPCIWYVHSHRHTHTHTHIYIYIYTWLVRRVVSDEHSFLQQVNNFCNNLSCRTCRGFVYVYIAALLYIYSMCWQRKLRGQNLSRVFNTRIGCMQTVHLFCYEAKMSDLEFPMVRWLYVVGHNVARFYVDCHLRRVLINVKTNVACHLRRILMTF